MAVALGDGGVVTTADGCEGAAVTTAAGCEGVALAAAVARAGAAVAAPPAARVGLALGAVPLDGWLRGAEEDEGEAEALPPK